MKIYSILKHTLKQTSLAFAFGIVALTTTDLPAQSNSSTTNKEDIDFSKRWEAKLNHAISPDHSHTHRGDKTQRSCLSLVILEGVKNKELLTERLQGVLETYEERPSLPDFLNTEHFRFHYNTTGSNGVPIRDNNGNGKPDYVEFMAAEFENVYTKEIDGLGYSAPPSDGNEGGNSLYDVYISNIQEGVYGFVAPEDLIGDNPNSSVEENSASTSWMAMRNNYEGFGSESEAIQVTAAHEFFHAIQMGYNSEAATAFGFEGTAAWMEEEIYPGVDDNFQYLNSVFESPDIAINYDFLDDDDPDYFDNQNFWYGSWIFFQYLGENYGRDVVKIFWENLRSQSELAALKSAIVSQNTTFNAAFEDFFIANIVLSANDSSKPYFYGRAADYIEYLERNTDSEKVKIEGTINLSQSTKTWNSATDGNRRLMRFSADYIKINTRNEFIAEIESQSPDDREVGIMFVSFAPSGAVRVIKNFPASEQKAKIDVKNINSSEEMYLIVYRLGDDLDDYTSEQYSVKLTRTSSVTGIDDNLGATNYFKIASNPISNELSFVYQLDNQNLKNYKVTVTDILGRKMIESNSVDTPIQTSRWAKGTYFVTLLENKKPVAVRKIVVQ